jgi:hypothetical protein
MVFKRGNCSIIDTVPPFFYALPVKNESHWRFLSFLGGGRPFGRKIR